MAVSVALCVLGPCSALAEAPSTSGNAVHWNWTQGWHGVVPGKTTLREAEKKLGQGKLASGEKGEQIYRFPKDIEITVDQFDHKVKAIKVTGSVAPDDQFPLSKAAAVNKYQWGGHDAIGVKTTFSNSPDQQLKQLEFTEVRIVDDTIPSHQLHHPQY